MKLKPEIDIPSRVIFKVLAIITLFVAALLFLRATHVVMTWLLASFVLALALNPIVEWVERWAPKIRRGGAVAVVFIVVVLALAGFVYAFVPPLISESEQLVAQTPRYTTEFLRSSAGQTVQQYHLLDNIRNSQNQVVSFASSAGGSLVGLLQGLFASFIAALTIFVFTVFMLIEGPYWAKLFLQLLPKGNRADDKHMIGEMYRAVTAYMGAKLVLSLVAGVVTFILLLILHVPYALSLSLIVAIFDLIPLVGALLGAVVVVAVSLFTSLGAAIVITIFFSIFQQLEANLTQPLIMRHSVQLTSLTVLVAALLGAELAGILGALLAIPVAACIQILIRERFAERFVA